MTQNNSTEFHSDMVFQERENDLIIPPFGVNRKQPFVFRDPEEFSSFEFSVGEFLGQSWWHLAKQLIRRGTLPETNIAPEYQWLEDDFLLGKQNLYIKADFSKWASLFWSPYGFWMWPLLQCFLCDLQSFHPKHRHFEEDGVPILTWSPPKIPPNKA